MSDDVKLPTIAGVGRTVTRDELEENVRMYGQWIRNSGLPPDVMIVVVLAPKDNLEMGAISALNCDLDQAKTALEKAAKRCKDRRVVRPT